MREGGFQNIRRESPEITALRTEERALLQEQASQNLKDRVAQLRKEVKPQPATKPPSIAELTGVKVTQAKDFRIQ